MRKKIAVLPMILLSLFVQKHVFPETIILKSGKIITGEIIEKNDDYIRVNFRGIPSTYYLFEIESIYKQETDLAPLKAYDGPDNRWFVFHFRKGKEHLRDKEFRQAIEEFRKAIKINPGFAGGYNNLGIAYDNLGFHQEAIDSYLKAIEIFPAYAKAHYNLGQVYSSLGQQYKAIDCYQQVIKISPDDAECYNELGNSYYALGQRHKAIDYYKKAISMDSDDARFYNNLGIAFKSIGRKQRAKESFLKIKEIYQREGNQEAVRQVKEYISKLH